MKKIIFFISALWISFLAYLVFRDRIDEFFATDKKIPKDHQSADKNQASKAPPKRMVANPEVDPLEKNSSSVSSVGVVPFKPLPEATEGTDESMNQGIANRIGDSLTDHETQAVDSKDEKESVPDLSNPFGLMITKFERLPSRFRLVSWKGSKMVELEDLENYKEASNSFPRHWLKVGVPYVEYVNPNTKDSVFKPRKNDNSKVRIQVISFEVRNQILPYSNLAKQIGYLILKDYKIGGAPYEITNEMQAPLTSAYAIHCQQHFGANKVFHDLSGKGRGFKFGRWDVEYNIHRFNFPDRKLIVDRKDLKTKKRSRKEISAPEIPL